MLHDVVCKSVGAGGAQRPPLPGVALGLSGSRSRDQQDHGDDWGAGHPINSIPSTLGTPRPERTTGAWWPESGAAYEHLSKTG